ncbi:MAG: hypothetical protein C0592_12500, partial [Marinilabiliales bacterium]
MKRLLQIRKTGLIFMFMFLFSSVSYACDYTIELYDDFGDGWNGGTVTVLVNGVAVPALTNITLGSGAGPALYTIAGVVDGDQITTTYTAGSWAYENYYYIYDATGTEVGSDGVGGVTPTGISTPIVVACPIALDASIASISVGECPTIQNVNAELLNSGLNTLTSDTIYWTLDGVPQTPVYWTGSLTTGNSEFVTLGSFLAVAGNTYNIVAWSASPNGGVDGNISNDTATFAITISNIGLA